jgi:hypothetical protein
VGKGMKKQNEDPPDLAPSEEVLVFLNRDIDALESPSATARVRAIEAICEQARFDAVPKLKELLDDDAPVIWDDVVGEVRLAALAGLQRLYWAGRRQIDFGPVLVRPAWPLVEMRRAYQAAIAELSTGERDAVLARADDYLRTTVRPIPAHAPDARAYRVLQELGMVQYERQPVDPTTKLTPLQQTLYAQQLASPRTRPFLRVALRGAPDVTVGSIYRDPAKGICAIRFSEHPAAVDAQEIVTKVLSLGYSGVPRIVHDEKGRPMRHPDGRFVIDGDIALDSDDVAGYLRTFAAFLQREFAVELLLPEPSEAREE